MLSVKLIFTFLKLSADMRVSGILNYSVSAAVPADCTRSCLCFFANKTKFWTPLVILPFRGMVVKASSSGTDSAGIERSSVYSSSIGGTNKF